MSKLTEKLDEMNREEIDSYFKPIRNNITEKVAVIREKYVDITGDFKLALILNQFIYWTPRTGERYKRWILEEFSREEGDLEGLEGGWIWKKAEEVADETMMYSSEQTIHNYLNDLIEMGFLQKRKNPDNKFDQTLQYRVNLKQVVFALWKSEKGRVIELGQENLIITEKLLQSLKSPNFKNLNSDSKNLDTSSKNSTYVSESTSENTFKTERDSEDKSKIDTLVKNKYREVFNKEFKDDFIKEIIKKHSVSKDLLLKAIDYCSHNAQYPSYLNKLLADWTKNGLNTPRQVEKYLENRLTKSKHSNYSSNDSNNPDKNKVEELEAEGWT